MMNDFKKYATKHLGINSMVLDDVVKSQAGYSQCTFVKRTSTQTP